jgi:hypothetical protein
LLSFVQHDHGAHRSRLAWRFSTGDDPEINQDKMKHEWMGLPYNGKRKATGRADRFR